MARALYLRLLGAVAATAFVSLWTQVHGLVGTEGILPAGEQLEAASARFGESAWRRVPTLCWLTGAGDKALGALCAAGTALSALLIAGVLPPLTLAGIWAVWLSLVAAGQDFLSFQWDVLLLEAAFFSIPLGPWRLRPGLHAGRPPSGAALLLPRLVLFKLLFLSGATKLLSGDASWWELDALPVHYETQPLPTWIGWHAFHAPEFVQHTAQLAMFAVELAVPFLVFGPRLARRAAALLVAGLMAGIALTGNYGFFNLLTAVLCVPLLDDAFFRRLRLPWRRRSAPTDAGPPEGASGDGPRPDTPGDGGEATARVSREPGPDAAHAPSPRPPSEDPAERTGGHAGDAAPRPRGTRRWRRRLGVAAVAALVGLVVIAHAVVAAQELLRTWRGASWPEDGPRPPAWVETAVEALAPLAENDAGRPRLAALRPFRTVNGYGLFRVLTTERPEIVIEGSEDGTTWSAYPLPWKPGDPQRRPRFVAPHQPRLDWQLWFAALNLRGHLHWLEPLLERLLEGSPDVIGLFERNPFPDGPPAMVRLALYRYRFTDPGTRRATGRWWERTLLGRTRPLRRTETR